MKMNARIWVEQCDASRVIEDEFGVPKALAYLVGEKFINFLEASDSSPEFRAEIPNIRRRDQEHIRAIPTGRIS
jgi:hypothetical protein